MDASALRSLFAAAGRQVGVAVIDEDGEANRDRARTRSRNREAGSSGQTTRRTTGTSSSTTKPTMSASATSFRTYYADSEQVAGCRKCRPASMTSRWWNCHRAGGSTGGCLSHRPHRVRPHRSRRDGRHLHGRTRTPPASRIDLVHDYVSMPRVRSLDHRCRNQPGGVRRPVHEVAGQDALQTTSCKNLARKADRWSKSFRLRVLRPRCSRLCSA